jgi:hypothetical protein
MKVSTRLLKLYYLIIPISLLAIIVDHFVLDGFLKRFLPQSPNEFFLFTLFFVLPHIVASLLTFGHKSYLNYYKNNLIIYTFGALVLTSVFLFLTPQKVYLAIFGLMTLYHVIGQQFGLNAAFSGVRDKNYLIWKYLGFTIAALASVLLFFPAGKNMSVYNNILFSIGSLLVAFLVFTYFCVMKSNSKLGREYFILNFLLIFFVFIFIAIGYSFFAIVLPRVVHDLTAFNFYIVHNYNRVHTNKSLWFNSIRYSVLWTIGFAITIAFIINRLDFTFLILFITLLHYGIESFIWKGRSLHKTFIQF